MNRMSVAIPRNDSLKRSESAQRSFKRSKSLTGRNGNPDNVACFVSKDGYEHPWEGSPFNGMPAAINSAPTAHTVGMTGGPALPGGPASRDAEATLGAVGSARVAKFTLREVLAARVEPHLVAITFVQSPTNAARQRRNAPDVAPQASVDSKPSGDAVVAHKNSGTSGNKPDDEKPVPAVTADAQTNRADQSSEEAAIVPYYNNFFTTYRLGPEDVISVTVFGQERYSKRGIVIPPSGRISLALIPAGTFVNGKTVDGKE